MTEVELKAYVRKVMEMEIAIYARKKLMAEHRALINNYKPEVPVEKVVKFPRKPVEPQKPEKRDFDYEEAQDTTKATGIASIFWGIFGGENDNKMVIKEQREREYQEAVAKYHQELQAYEQTWEAIQQEYREKKTEAEKAYQEEMIQYNRDLKLYKSNKEEILKRHKKVIRTLENALKKTYEEDVIFPKYRNIVCVATMNEYLESGRCNTLEGPDGAYNLYEAELRQNIIIGNLEDVIVRLEQIRGDLKAVQANQYVLYTELKHANGLVNKVLREFKELNNQVRLNNAINEKILDAVSAERTIYGIVF